MTHGHVLRVPRVRPATLDEALRRTMLALALAGLAIAAYLSYEHATGGTAACLGGGGGCAAVQQSPHLELLGVYIPYLALGGYGAAVASLLRHGPAARLATVAVAFAGVAMTSYVLYLQAAVIEAWCPWCLISTALMWAIAGLASWRYVGEIAPGPRQTPDKPPGDASSS